MKVYVATIMHSSLGGSLGRYVVAVGKSKGKAKVAGLAFANTNESIPKRIGIKNRELVQFPFVAKDIELNEFDLL